MNVVTSMLEKTRTIIFNYKMYVTFLCQLENFPAPGRELTSVPGQVLALPYTETPLLHFTSSANDVHAVDLNFSRASVMEEGKYIFLRLMYLIRLLLSVTRGTGQNKWYCGTLDLLPYSIIIHHSL